MHCIIIHSACNACRFSHWLTFDVTPKKKEEDKDAVNRDLTFIQWGENASIHNWGVGVERHSEGSEGHRRTFLEGDSE